ncbi:PREDICTED: uncharacterized protein LOC108966022 isoform X2 [Bactrocera latifrons]|uniref:uncharacterized protein LOC108966022 isoform X2 n=1 Tax=Bactrocera latifrons TaxID=174628 RepID=UPI0008DE1CD4|nr:PREDICTED: uncharacterized protein LOC108966022 isoform X2 [Bactrocera latifrons]
MPLDTESTALLSKEQLKSNGNDNEHKKEQSKSQSHYIEVVEKPIYNGYTTILGEEDFSASLTLEELLPFINDSWWQKLRRTLFCTFCLVFWLILFTGCMLAYMERNKQCGILIARATTPTNTNGRKVYNNAMYFLSLVREL